ncbi:general L-amino acid transport system permease protein [Paracoccus isoporae]|uniref:General L-amino acid transport system permease protein n=1 Tax=Paracoccus isoporae TaxID=591205 RepID=A0A1G6W5N3_9RHOB|nr:amino acid ABC transporter permease [Paracoccus isoporae]SDD61149.1 general L-amino acid transport system permease protein [Paracoccus isoporae]
MSEMHAESVAYVRDTMLPPAAPPNQQLGALRWLRVNLFSGWFNTVLTLLGLGIIWFLFDHFWPWLSHSVWKADSVQECREIIAARYGEGATGGCFGVIRERWHQYLFGFYPRAEYWRPLMTLGLLFIAITPVLFSVNPAIRRWVLAVTGLITLLLMGVAEVPDWAVLLMWALIGTALLLGEYAPQRLLIFTLFYPVVGVWFLWGGSLWFPLMLLAGFGVGYLATRLVPPRHAGLALPAGIAAALIWWLFLAGPVAGLLGDLAPARLRVIDSNEFGGFLLAMVIGVSGIAMSLPLGIVLALARRSDMFLIHVFAVIFIEFIRGVPLITLLFVASLLLNYFLPPGTNFDIILRVIIMVTIFAAAYMAEVIRGGLAALPRGQFEAADALGLNYWQAQRLIVLPQALKISIPGIVGTFIGMFKDTTLVGLIGLFDPLKGISDFVRSNFAWKGIYWEPFIFVGAIFFVICFSMSRYSMYLERRLSREHR